MLFQVERYYLDLVGSRFTIYEDGSGVHVRTHCVDWALNTHTVCAVQGTRSTQTVHSLRTINV